MVDMHWEEEPAGSDTGYQKTLANFQIQMIAFGGAIGVGLFLGSAGARRHRWEY